MMGVKVEISRYIDDSQPGFVECKLVDVWGEAHTFIEKVPVVTDERLDSSSDYPRSGIIGCQIIERRFLNEREALSIETETLWHIESIAGKTCFDVLPGQLIKIDTHKNCNENSL